MFWIWPKDGSVSCGINGRVLSYGLLYVCNHSMSADNQPPSVLLLRTIDIQENYGDISFYSWKWWKVWSKDWMTPYCISLWKSLKNGTVLASDAALGLINYPWNPNFNQCNDILGDRLNSLLNATHCYCIMIETQKLLTFLRGYVQESIQQWPF